MNFRATFIFSIALLVFIPGSTIFAHESGEAHIIHITKNGFEPKELTIEQGETITFENVDMVDHWVASDIHPTHSIYPEFDPKRGLKPGESWSFTFNRFGLWKMHDHLHASFVGEIKVIPQVGGEEPSQTATSTPSSLGSRIKLFFVKLFYKVFPARLENKLNATSFQNVDDESAVTHWLELAGPKKVMTRLLTESNGGSTFDCHQQAHKIGRIAYEVLGAEAFKEGNSNCHSGFYHGAMEAMLHEKGTDNLILNVETICKEFETNFGIFECLHGIGHGLMAYENYDLPVSLNLCSELSNTWEQRSCYGGAFMENIVASQGIGALSDHKTTWINNDPQFPCNTDFTNIDMKYECYQMQTARMLMMTNYDFSKVPAMCMDVKDPFRETCFQSFGRDGAGNANRDPHKIVKFCSMVPENFYDACIRGAVNVIIDFWGEGYTNQADPVCAMIPTEHQRSCYSLIEQRMNNDFKKVTTKS